MLNQTIAIVGMGCVLPGAENPDEFWNNCLSGKSAIAPISAARWDSSLYLSSNRFDIDKTYSVLAAEVAQNVYEKLRLKYNFKIGEATRMELLITESCQQALSRTKHSQNRKKIGFILGVMSPDEEHYFAHAKKIDKEILSYLRSHLKSENSKVVDELALMIEEKEDSHSYARSTDRILTSEILEKVSNRFQIQGLRFIIDAACASSLASLDQCCHFLSSGEWDMAISGGAETNLAPGSFSLFSRVGGLALNHCRPFDSTTEGLVQGEGAGIVVLKRLADAIADQDPILAIIKGVNGSSDGKTSSLFQPNDKGQKLALNRVYSKLSEKKITYLEGHGTGTVIGDKTELNAVADYFSDQTLPMGSVKSLIGHTKGTAGVANLIKVLNIIREGVIPGMKYISQPLPSNNVIQLSQDKIILTQEDKKRIGVSAFGFGGTNYHATLEPFKNNTLVPLNILSLENNHQANHKCQDEIQAKAVFIIGEAELSLNKFDPSWFTSPDGVYRVPPQSIPYIDKSQLLAVKTAELAMWDAKLKYDEFPNDDVMVISSSILGLDIAKEQTGRVRSTMMMEAVKKYVKTSDVSEVLSLIENYRNKTTPFSEDSAAGVLNNVIAGRVCNAFDFHGRSYNIEVRDNASSLALKLAIDELSTERAPVVFLITVNEDLNYEEFNIKRNKIKCQILCNQSFAEKNFLKPKAVLLLKHKLKQPKEVLAGIHFDIHLNQIDQTIMNRAAVIFPGQGSIYPNRYVNYIGYSEVFKKRFAEADKLALSKGLKSISELANEDSKNSDNEYPSSTEVLMRNLFQLTVEATLFDLLLERGIHPAILTGHSFGEIPGLYCAGVYSFERAFEIVCLREEISPVPGEIGTLVAIALSEEKFKSLNMEVECSIANINSKDQIVLSVRLKDLHNLLIELRKKKVAAKELKSIGRPYHSQLMLSAAEKFRQRLDLLNWGEMESKYGFISSVDGLWYPANTKFKKEEIVKLLSEQLLKPVLFPKQIELSCEKNINGFIELGLDRTLGGFAKSNISHEKKYTIITAEELLLKKKKGTPKKVFKFENNKYIEMVSNIVSSVTGYKIEEITLEQQFEEDLRIDSIKKAEIFFRCLEEAQGVSDPSIEVSSFKQVGDFVEFFQSNEGKVVSQNMQATKPSFALYRHELKVSPLIFKSKINHPEMVKINLNEIFKENSDNLDKFFKKEKANQLIFYQQTIVFMVPDELLVNYTPADLTSQLLQLARLTKEISNYFLNPIIIIHARQDHSLFRGYRSFLKSLRLELKSFSVKCVVDSDHIYFKTWRAESEDQLITDIVWKDGIRRTMNLVEVSEPGIAKLSSVVFSIGGSRGILRQYFSHFDKNSCASLFFTGRASVNNKEVQDALNDFRNHFDKVIYFQMDATHPDQLSLAFKKAIEQFGKIDLLLDASGVEMSRLFENKNHFEIEQEISSKVSVRENIERQNIRPQKEIYFNSVAALYGNHGQSVYAFTNSYVAGKKRGIHLFWPPLEGLGMTSDVGILMKLKMMGVDLLPKVEVEKFLLLVSSIQINEEHDFSILSLRSHFLMNLLFVAPVTVSKIFGQVLLNQKAQAKWILDKATSLYLQDHVVNANCIAPGSMGLASFVMAGKVSFQSLPVVENFEMHNFILLDRGPIEIFISLDFNSSSHISAKIFSKYNNYEAQLKSNSDANKNSSAKKISNISIEREFELSEFYSKKFIDYGPSFRVLNKVGISGDNKIFAISHVDEIQRVGDHEFDYLTSFYEACVQTAATKCLLETKALALPTGIGRVTHFSNNHSRIIYLTTGELIPGADPYNFSTDVYVYNDEGELIARADKVMLKTFVQLKEFPLVIKKASLVLCH